SACGAERAAPARSASWRDPTLHMRLHRARTLLCAPPARTAFTPMRRRRRIEPMGWATRFHWGWETIMKRTAIGAALGLLLILSGGGAAMAGEYTGNGGDVPGGRQGAFRLSLLRP